MAIRTGGDDRKAPGDRRIEVFDLQPDGLRQLLREMEVEVDEHAPDLVCEAPVGDLFSAGKECLLLLLELPLGDPCLTTTSLLSVRSVAMAVEPNHTPRCQQGVAEPTETDRIGICGAAHDVAAQSRKPVPARS
jgi:hypothetical protein